MSHNGRTITGIKSKANVFIIHYTRVSKLNMLQFHRDTNRQFKKRLSAPSVDDESCDPILMGESKKWKVKEQPALTTLHLHLLSHSVLWPSRNNYPYSTHHFYLLIVHESGVFSLSFQYLKLGNFLGKSPLSAPSVSRHVSLNFLNVFLLTVSTILRKPTTCSVDSKPVFVKDEVVKIRLLE